MIFKLSRRLRFPVWLGVHHIPLLMSCKSPWQKAPRREFATIACIKRAPSTSPLQGIIPNINVA